MKFSDALTYYRERSDLNKTQLAEKIGIKPEYIVALEKGHKKPPTFERCEQIARILNLSDSEKKKFLTLAFEERLGVDADFLHEIGQAQPSLSAKETEKISSEVLKAIADPVALKALLITYKGTEDVKRAVKQLLETFPTMSSEKRKAILALCN